MYFSSVVLLNLAFALVFERSTSQADCNGCCDTQIYKTINEPRRSINSIWKRGQTALCDRSLSWGWYRFTSYVGGQMPTSHVSPNHCGTVAPVWLQGKHPVSVANGTVTVKACINFFNLSNGCSRSFDVKIRMCSGSTPFFVYYLRPTYSCAIAYCAGTRTPCPYGEVNHGGQCVGAPAVFDRDYLGEPTITYLPADPRDATVILECKVPVNPKIKSWANVTYQIVWYSEGIHLKTDDRICPVLPPPIHGTTDIPDYDSPCLLNKPLFSHLYGSEYRVNSWISCNVTARHFKSNLSSWSIPKTVRSPFFAGIQVYPSVLTIEECSNEEYFFFMNSTIPVGTGTLGNALTVYFLLPDGILMARQQCNVDILDRKQVEVRIIARCTNGIQPTRADKVIVPKILGTHSEFWSRNDFFLPAIWVSVFARNDIHHCRTYTDPHYKSLPTRSISGVWGSWLDFTFMGHGDFVLYNNSERNFEIHTRQWACVDDYDTLVTCNCGVVLRDHNDVIEFSCCNERLFYDLATPLRLRVKSKKSLAPGISIRQSIPGFDNRYTVLFPSGVEVKIYRNDYGLSIDLITPRAKNGIYESGLCLFDGQSDVKQFGDKFRLEYQESYFNVLPRPINDVVVRYDVPCSCEVDNTCLIKLPTHYYNALTKDGKVVRAVGGGDRRKKRDVEYLDDVTDEDFEMFKRFVGLGVSRRRKRSSALPQFSKQNATRYCMEMIADSDVGKLCAKLGSNVQALVNSCSIDLELSGEISFAIAAVSLQMNECGGIVGRNMSSYVNKSSPEISAEIPSYLSEIVAKLCPNDCTFNGKCVNGTCICNEEYTAEDCAMSIYQIPDLSMLQGNGLCDRRKRPCKKVTVMGTGFINSTNMTCHVREFTVINGSWTPNNTEFRLPAVMTDLVLTDCHLPESPVMPGYFHQVQEGTAAAGLVISISNDGEHKSVKNLTFLSYDSACMRCNVSTGCDLKDNSCFINGYCFSPNEPNPIDWCYQCLPDASKNIWTKRKVNLPPRFTSTNQYYALYQENLELAIDVSDPEGMPVTVSLMDGSPSEAVMRDNVLVWNATSDANTQFYFKATDACQAFSMFNVTVSLRSCQCQNGSCIPHPKRPRGSGLYECNCIPGFTGVKCETNINDCQSYPCLRGRCVDEVNQFRCICDRGYVGKKCDIDYNDCSSSPCIHGICIDYPGTYRCTCHSGYSGPNCTIDINECHSTPCTHGTCIDQLNGYKCQCEYGYTGKNCDVNIDECQSSPCINGNCVDKVNGFNCICKAGYTGITCEVNINECLQAPCGNGSCVDRVNNYSCICNAGFTGQHCDVVITICSNDSCYAGVLCTENSNSISCDSCPSGFTGDGKNCKDVNDCVNHTCGNGGSCVDGINSYTCTCLRGFTGNHCDANVDDCVNRTCANGGSCVDGINSYSCNCLPGFTGNHCEKDVDNCVNHTCANGGSCVDGFNSYTCTCSVGFTGGHCENNIDDCVNITCKNGGSCIDEMNNFTCSCPTGYTGDLCETDIDDCVSAICANGATCVDGVNQYFCTCPEGFTGKLCERALTATVATETSSSESTSVPSTPEEVATSKRPTDEVSDERKTVFTLEIRIKEDWDAKLKDRTSEKFKKLSKLLKEEILKAYSGNSELKEVEIISMRSGSIIADFKLTFKTSVTVKEAMAPLKKETADGKLGSLGVDPNSLKPKVSKQDGKKENESSTINLPLIIGVSCGSFVVLVVLAICFVFHCNRSSVSSRSNSRVGDEMPADESCSKSEKYELKSRNKKCENIIWMEEKGVWNEGME